MNGDLWPDTTLEMERAPRKLNTVPASPKPKPATSKPASAPAHGPGDVYTSSPNEKPTARTPLDLEADAKLRRGSPRLPGEALMRAVIVAVIVAVSLLVACSGSGASAPKADAPKRPKSELPKPEAVAAVDAPSSNAKPVRLQVTTPELALDAALRCVGQPDAKVPWFHVEDQRPREPRWHVAIGEDMGDHIAMLEGCEVTVAGAVTCEVSGRSCE